MTEREIHNLLCAMTAEKPFAEQVRAVCNELLEARKYVPPRELAKMLDKCAALATEHVANKYGGIPWDHADVVWVAVGDYLGKMLELDHTSEKSAVEAIWKHIGNMEKRLQALEKPSFEQQLRDIVELNPFGDEAAQTAGGFSQPLYNVPLVPTPDDRPRRPPAPPKAPGERHAGENEKG